MNPGDVLFVLVLLTAGFVTGWRACLTHYHWEEVRVEDDDWVERDR